MTANENALTVNHLCVTYGNGVTAVRDLSLAVKPGEVLGVMGHSGSGKTSLARALVGLVPHRGEVFLSGQNAAVLGRKERSRLVQPIFQNPYSSLNPALTVGQILAEPLRIHKPHPHSRAQCREAAAERLASLSLPPSSAKRYLRELSGGERQRVAIGCAFMLDAPLLIADEICSALDVLAQATVLNLLQKRVRERNMAGLFISHDPQACEWLSDRILHLKDGGLCGE
jgi:ABC-type dipeptide/oligopeptide/nickel transport system ATPase subunit